MTLLWSAPALVAFVAAAMTSLAPVAAFATPVETGASRVSLAVGMRGEASASTKGMTIAASPSTCFSASPSHADLLHVERTIRSETERGSKMRFEFRAQHAGSCTIVFHSGKDHTTVDVTVTP